MKTDASCNERRVIGPVVPPGPGGRFVWLTARTAPVASRIWVVGTPWRVQPEVETLVKITLPTSACVAPWTGALAINEPAVQAAAASTPEGEAANPVTANRTTTIATVQRKMAPCQEDCFLIVRIPSMKVIARPPVDRAFGDNQNEILL